MILLLEAKENYLRISYEETIISNFFAGMRKGRKSDLLCQHFKIDFSLELFEKFLKGHREALELRAKERLERWEKERELTTSL